MTTNTIQIPEIRWPTLQAFESFRKSYDKRRDTLFVYKEPKAQDASFSIGMGAWLRLADDGEVVGLEIEDFEMVFLRHHPELEMGWKELKPTIIKRVKREADSPAMLAAFIMALTEQLKRSFMAHPPQLRYS